MQSWGVVRDVALPEKKNEESQRMFDTEDLLLKEVVAGYIMSSNDREQFLVPRSGCL